VDFLQQCRDNWAILFLQRKLECLAIFSRRLMVLNRMYVRVRANSARMGLSLLGNSGTKRSKKSPTTPWPVLRLFGGWCWLNISSIFFTSRRKTSLGYVNPPRFIESVKTEDAGISLNGTTCPSRLPSEGSLLFILAAMNPVKKYMLKFNLVFKNPLTFFQFSILK
jgi:hypothetical protein